jgi:hypothetical protein
MPGERVNQMEDITRRAVTRDAVSWGDGNEVASVPLGLWRVCLQYYRSKDNQLPTCHIIVNEALEPLEPFG